MRSVEVIVIALTSPILVGIYEESVLVETHQSDEKSSEYLPMLFETLLSRYDIRRIVYANGPGSFMAIKISYLFLKTVEIVQGIPLMAASAFTFNGHTPIKAMGTIYFHETPTGVVMKPLEDTAPQEMRLPHTFDSTQYSIECAPNYIIPAVG